MGVKITNGIQFIFKKGLVLSVNSGVVTLQGLITAFIGEVLLFEGIRISISTVVNIYSSYVYL